MLVIWEKLTSKVTMWNSNGFVQNRSDLLWKIVAVLLMSVTTVKHHTFLKTEICILAKE